MSYAIDIPASLIALMEELPARTGAALCEVFVHLAELAELCSPEDERWDQIAQREEQGLRFYVDGCCVRVELCLELHRLRVREIGRVLVHLPAEDLSYGLNL